MNKKRFLAVIVIGVFMLAFVNAAWIFYFETNVIADIVGGGNPLIASVGMSNFLLNTSEDGVGSVRAFSLDVREDVNVLVGINEVVTDLTNGQCDYSNDCDTYLYYLANRYDDGDSLLLYEGSNNVGFIMDCVKNSCETSRDITITFEEI
jgi:hypothetical protein